MSWCMMGVCQGPDESQFVSLDVGSTRLCRDLQRCSAVLEIHPPSKGLWMLPSQCAAVCSLRLYIVSSLLPVLVLAVLPRNAGFSSPQINVSFFIVPNAYVLYNRCGVFAELVAVSGIIRWTCWNTVSI